jgi:sulfoxide reductase heme-binding subunit YedZ
VSSEQIDSALWYLGRSAGVVALVLLTITVVLGVVTRSGRPLPGLPRFAVAEVHRSTSLLAVSLLAAHIGTLTLDPQAQLRWLDAVLPFRAAWRPGWVGLGTLTIDILLAVVVTSLLRDRIGHRVWRLVHWAAYALWPTAMLHSLGSGSDASSHWFVALAVGCAGAVVGAAAWRGSVALTGRGFHDDQDRVPGSRRPITPRRPAQLPQSATTRADPHTTTKVLQS